MAIIMSLFSDAEMIGVCPADRGVQSSVSSVPSEASAPSVGVLSEPAPPQVVEVAARLGADWGSILNPCAQCRYGGICDDDYCAMLLHPIDMPHAPTARGWRNYGL